MIPVGTHFLHPDEKAYALVELNQLTPDYKGQRRFQLIYVNRGDMIAEHRKDLGAAKRFKAPQFRVPSLWEHTVGELWDIADQYRIGDDYAQKRTAEIAAESTLITDFLNWTDEKKEIIHNRTINGPGYVKQRNGFSRKAAKDAYYSRTTA